MASSDGILLLRITLFLSPMISLLHVRGPTRLRTVVHATDLSNRSVILLEANHVWARMWLVSPQRVCDISEADGESSRLSRRQLPI